MQISKNKRLSYVRFVGITKAAGKYIAFLDMLALPKKNVQNVRQVTQYTCTPARPSVCLSSAAKCVQTFVDNHRDALTEMVADID